MRILGKQASLLVLLLAGCGGPSNQLPIHTAAVTFDPKSQKYQLSKVQLSTITDLETLTGSVANIQGGAEVVIDSTDPMLQSATSNDEIKKAILKDEGGPVRASFVTSGDTQFPADFHSENMVTTYYNLERSFDFYHSLGWTQDLAGTPTVFYFPTFIETDLSKAPIKDNAAFFAIVGGFMILPFDQLQDVPLPMNLGIIGHEYSHFMVNTRVYDREAIPQAYIDYGAFSSGVPTPAANLLKSFDEGFADLFGTGVTCGDDLSHCDPNFIAASISFAAADRRLDTKHCFDQTLYAHWANDPLDTFLAGSHEYELGTVLASSVWRAANDPDVVGQLGQGPAVKAAMQAVYDALDDSSSNGFGLKQALVQLKGQNVYVRPDTLIANLVVYHAAPPGQTNALGNALCNAFYDRLGSYESLAGGFDACGTACTSPSDSKEVFTDTQSGQTFGCICACQQYKASHSNGECAQ